MEKMANATSTKSQYWDDPADISTLHLSFIVNLLLPRHLITKENPRVRVEDAITKLNERGRQMYGEDPPSKYVAVGSSAESYEIPRVVTKRTAAEIQQAVNYSDIDVLVAWNLGEPIREVDPNATKKQKLVLETGGVHSGYCRLLVNDPESVLRGVHPSTAITYENRPYFNAMKVKKDLEVVMQQTVLETFSSNLTKIVIDQKGPAVGLEDLRMRTRKFFEEKKSVDHPRQELVAALPIVWPRVANEWVERNRKNEWLSPEMITKIVNAGCHVVPVSHRHSQHPDIEWRLSFATSEVLMAKEVVNDYQRSCYIYLKLLRQEIGKSTDLLSSYHFKTVFLYSCEELDLCLWEDNPGSCVIYVLDTMMRFVRERWLPSYFLPGNNLLDHLSESEFEKVESILISVRIDPISPILNFMDTNIIGNQSAVTTFRKLIDPVISDIQVFKGHMNAMLSAQEFIHSLALFVSSLMLDGKVEDAVFYVSDMYPFLSRFGSTEFHTYIASFVTKWKLVTQTISYIKYAIKHCSDDYPGVNKLYGYLGCLYHTLSYHFPKQTTMNKSAIQSADDCFKRIKVVDDTTDASKTYYALYLLACCRYDECINVVKELTEIEEASQNTVCNFNSSVLVTIEKNLRKDIVLMTKTPQTVDIPATTLALYILFVADNHSGKLQQEAIVDRFAVHCQRTGTFWSYFLIAKCLKLMKRFADARESFHKANTLQKNLICLAYENTCQIEFLLTEKSPDDALSYFLNVPVEEFSNNRMVLFNSIAFRFSSLILLADFAEKVFEVMEKEDKKCFDFRGNLACLLFALAFEHEIDSEEQTIALIKAETLFNTYLLERPDVQTATSVDFAAYLLKRGRFTEAKEVLKNFLSKPPSNSRNAYGFEEYNNVLDILKNEIDIHTVIDAPSQAFAYMFLVESLIKSNESEDKIRQVIEEFESYATEQKTSRVFSLLGYCELLTGNKAPAEHWFCKAVKASWDYTAAKLYIAMCRTQNVKDNYEIKYTPLGLVTELRGTFEPI